MSTSTATSQQPSASFVTPSSSQSSSRSVNPSTSPQSSTQPSASSTTLPAALTFDLVNTPATETIRYVSHYLRRIISVNDSTANSATTQLTRFHARTIPTIDVLGYLSRILKYAPCGNECFIAVLIYLERMADPNSEVNSGSQMTPFVKMERSRVKRQPVVVNSYNVHRLLISGIMVAVKFLSDIFFTNAHISRVGGLPVQELNQLELEFLLLNDFTLTVSIEDLQACGNRVVASVMRDQSINDALRQHLYITAPGGGRGGGSDGGDGGSGSPAGGSSNAAKADSSSSRPTVSDSSGKSVGGGKGGGQEEASAVSSSNASNMKVDNTPSGQQAASTTTRRSTLIQGSIAPLFPTQQQPHAPAPTSRTVHPSLPSLQTVCEQAMLSVSPQTPDGTWPSQHQSGFQPTTYQNDPFTTKTPQRSNSYGSAPHHHQLTPVSPRSAVFPTYQNYGTPPIGFRASAPGAIAMPIAPGGTDYNMSMTPPDELAPTLYFRPQHNQSVAGVVRRASYGPNASRAHGRHSVVYGAEFGPNVYPSLPTPQSVAMTPSPESARSEYTAATALTAATTATCACASCMGDNNGTQGHTHPKGINIPSRSGSPSSSLWGIPIPYRGDPQAPTVSASSSGSGYVTAPSWTPGAFGSGGGGSKSHQHLAHSSSFRNSLPSRLQHLHAGFHPYSPPSPPSVETTGSAGAGGLPVPGRVGGVRRWGSSGSAYVGHGMTGTATGVRRRGTVGHVPVTGVQREELVRSWGDNAPVPFFVGEEGGWVSEETDDRMREE